MIYRWVSSLAVRVQSGGKKDGKMADVGGFGVTPSLRDDTGNLTWAATQTAKDRQPTDLPDGGSSRGGLAGPALARPLQPSALAKVAAVAR